MDIEVKVKTRASENTVVLKEGIYCVSVKEAPEHVKANRAVIKVLTKYFKKNVRIVKGFTNKKKIVRVE